MLSAKYRRIAIELVGAVRGQIVTGVKVRVVPQGRGYRLDLYNEDVYIGEHERSWAAEESGDLKAKVGEAEGASDLLIEASAPPTAR